MKRKQKNQLSQACLLGLLFFVLVSIFIFQPREVRALTGDYNKAINGTLAASEWNNLVNDFVAKSGSRLDGYFSINTATSSTYALDINGALRATSIEGSYTGFLNAANISSGQFGANAGFGNFSFPGNVGIGTTNPRQKLEVAGNMMLGDVMINGTGSEIKLTDISGVYNKNIRANSFFLAGPMLAVAGSMSGDTWTTFAKDRTYVANTVDYTIAQNNLTSDTTVRNIIIRAQNAYSSATSNLNGGNVYLYGGTKTGAGSDGNVVLGHTGSTSLGNVGIGTTTPGATLDVNGLIKMRTALITANDDVVNKGYLDSALASTTAQIITQVSTSSFWQGSMAGNIYNSNAGNVGIGTINPSALFTVAASNTPQIRILDEDASGSAGVDSTIAFGRRSSSPVLYGTIGFQANNLNISHQTSVGGIKFQTNSSDRMFIDNSGNVGIGTTNPSTKLDINYQGVFNPVTPGLSSYYGLHFSGQTTSDYATGITWNGGSSGAQAGLYVQGSGAYGTKMYFATTNAYVTGAQTRMMIDHSGNVGIGTTTPSTRLTVVGSGNYSINAGNYRIGNVATPVSALDAVNKSYLDSAVGTAQTAFWNLNGSNLYASSTGWNVGIGTTNPTVKFQVNGDQVYFNLATSTAVAGLTINSNLRMGTSDNYAWIQSHSSRPLSINPLGNNVGIGTTNPTARLYVNGTSIFNDVATFTQPVVVGAPVLNTHAATKNYVDSQISSSTGAIAFWGGSLGGNLWNLNSGNIGIGTTAPNDKLVVSNGTGEIRFGGGNGRTLSAYNSGALANFDFLAVSTYFNSNFILASRKQIQMYNYAGTNPVYGKIHIPSNEALSFEVNGSDRLVIDSSGNVGIGTTNPTARLYVNGTSIFNDVATFTQPVVVGAPVLNTHAATKNYVDSQISSSTGAIAFWGGSLAGNVWSLNSGNVGIGTTNPGTPLAIQSTNHETLTLQRAASNVSWAVWEKFRLYNSSNSFVDYGYVGGGITTNTAGSHTGYLGFGVAQSGSLSEAMRLSSAGNLGIGTVNPNSRLHVYNTAANAEIDIQSLVGAGNHWGTYSNLSDNSYRIWGGSDYLTILRSGNIGIGTTAPGAYRLFVNGDTNVAGSVTASSFVGPLTGTINASNVSSGDFGAGTGGGVYSFPSNLGIGTTNPNSQLSIVDDTSYEPSLTAGAAANFNVARGVAGATDLVLTMSGAGPFTASLQHRHAVSNGIAYPIALNPLGGNVGIGTTNPEQKLDVNGIIQVSRGSNANVTNFNINAGATPINVFQYNTDYPNSNVVLNARNNWNLAFYTNDNEKMRLTSAGNVGIGTTNPGAYRLKVAGDMAVTGTLQTQTGSDFAEEFSVTEDLSAGTVVVMSNEGHKSVKAASSAYDRTVVGFVSDNPSIIAGKVDSEKKVVVAMMGVVSVNVSNSNGHIYKGDLLTSADLAGYAMKASEFKPGTIIGKALEDLKGAKGQIKVLVNLQ